MKNFKIFFAIVAMVLVGSSAMAQWTDNGTYSTTTDKIVIGGTTEDDNQLHVDGTSDFNGTAKFTRIKAVGANGELKFGWGAVNGADAIMYKNDHATYPGQMKLIYGGGVPSVGNFTVLNYDGSSYTTNLFIDAAGNMGVGTTSPTAKLTVAGDLSANGKITTKEIEVTLSGWPDYVFDDDYELKSLSEVEAYIKNNNHLPGVPSEKEILENGLQLGEMNKILMEKVEELTLHMIQLEKEIENLKKK